MESTLALLLTEKQAAALVGLSVRSIRRLTLRGVLPSLHPAGMRCVRYRRKEIEEWVRRGCPGY